MVNQLQFGNDMEPSAQVYKILDDCFKQIKTKAGKTLADFSAYYYVLNPEEHQFFAVMPPGYLVQAGIGSDLSRHYTAVLQYMKEDKDFDIWASLDNKRPVEFYSIDDLRNNEEDDNEGFVSWSDISEEYKAKILYEDMHWEVDCFVRSDTPQSSHSTENTKHKRTDKLWAKLQSLWSMAERTPHDNVQAFRYDLRNSTSNPPNLKELSDLAETRKNKIQNMNEKIKNKNLQDQPQTLLEILFHVIFDTQLAQTVYAMNLHGITSQTFNIPEDIPDCLDALEYIIEMKSFNDNHSTLTMAVSTYSILADVVAQLPKQEQSKPQQALLAINSSLSKHKDKHTQNPIDYCLQMEQHKRGEQYGFYFSDKAPHELYFLSIEGLADLTLYHLTGLHKSQWKKVLELDQKDNQSNQLFIDKLDGTYKDKTGDTLDFQHDKIEFTSGGAEPKRLMQLEFTTELANAVDSWNESTIKLHAVLELLSSKEEIIDWLKTNTSMQFKDNAFADKIILEKLEKWPSKCRPVQCDSTTHAILKYFRESDQLNAIIKNVAFCGTKEDATSIAKVHAIRDMLHNKDGLIEPLVLGRRAKRQTKPWLPSNFIMYKNLPCITHEQCIEAIGLLCNYLCIETKRHFRLSIMQKPYTENSSQFGKTRSGKVFGIDETPQRKTKNQKKNTKPASKKASDTAYTEDTADTAYTTTPKDPPDEKGQTPKPKTKKKMKGKTSETPPDVHSSSVTTGSSDVTNESGDTNTTLQGQNYEALEDQQKVTSKAKQYDKGNETHEADEQEPNTDDAQNKLDTDQNNDEPNNEEDKEHDLDEAPQASENKENNKLYQTKEECNLAMVLESSDQGEIALHGVVFIALDIKFFEACKKASPNHFQETGSDNECANLMTAYSSGSSFNSWPDKAASMILAHIHPSAFERFQNSGPVSSLTHYEKSFITSLLSSVSIHADQKNASMHDVLVMTMKAVLNNADDLRDYITDDGLYRQLLYEVKEMFDIVTLK